MDAIATWLKQTGGALFACLLLCLAVAPSVDNLICSSDVPTAGSSSAPQSDQLAAASHDGDGDIHGGSGGDACVHGHCHQTAAPAALLDAQLAEASTGAADLTRVETGQPPSRAPDNPMEPPRA